MSIVYIHGLNQTHLSFTYFAEKLGEKHIMVDYDSRQSLADSVKQVVKQLPKTGDLTLIGHSLGGVIAMVIAHSGVANVSKVVTISSPLGGSKAAVFARWVVSGIRVLGDITPTSVYMKMIEAMAAPCPVLSIISTSGSLLNSNEPNDGIVTVASQKALPYAKKVEVKANHFEILMHDKTIEAVRKFVQ